ncbi:acyl-CoA synthetase/AMP-acid ligase [Mycolicibacterium phlei]|jgi:propionyl-CoA synthetase|uniref:Acyl-CoA synthetase n=1 Tax=Mycolicibacterium phlei DSM 43239 = CCUG 21000 TaxID=1226750 RepID=A0A5N5VE07_MYCPH|nr:propionyl-CoA synthetase [Mycolicibacterium phlei]VEG11208.1 acyl-CoA synthetase/AMP-acid ligase [Mycobacteroides chelonae]AMO63111.1 Acetyl-coenzyme A synthetase [Mycolicibacterium phlei]EID09602.1 acyl-CoA synthetase/AMP-acid ligase [Mycolicibacterium phlei RIVM601174]KAB7760018.1 acyl-CoA synthetase [Mycolicibacterium phlei DSM 43239 = CCUG 21000]KXW64389.1 acyl-CoA synthetase [Mycolicibacterium phlei DSM 43072]
MTGYRAVFESSIKDPATFWAEAARAVTWTREPTKILDDSNPPFYRWFPDGELNTCANALDRHVEGGRADQAALIYDSPVTDTKRTYTYRELLDATARFAGGLRKLGVEKGDRVVIYMPMIPEALVAMLACARLGAVHSVVFGGFAAHELAARIDDAQPKVIVSASCGIEPSRTVAYKPMLDAALEMSEHPPHTCVIKQRDHERCDLIEGRDLDWDEVASADPVDPVPVAATDPLYVLYTSGTTGKPKGIVRDNGGYAVALLWSLRNIYDIHPGDVFWTASDVGWVVGHSYIVYAPLLLGATTVMYEGKPVGTPDPGAFWRVASETGAKALFTAPTAVRAIRKEDPDGEHIRRYDLSKLKYLFQAGERLDPDTYEWATAKLGIPVVDHWWQTETGWAIAANPMGLDPMPIKAGSPTVPMPGYDVRILRPDGTECDPGEEGAICIRLPLPPGTLPTLWGDDDRYVSSYLEEYPGYYLTGDGGYLDEDGYLFVMGRIDDVINVAGHRFSTGAIEAVLATHPAVAECAVIGVNDEIKGQVPRGFVVLKAGAKATGLADELVALVRENIGAVACFKLVDVVPALPKTRSGKILRKTMRGIAHGKDEPVPSTIEDASVLDKLRPILGRTDS